MVVMVISPPTILSSQRSKPILLNSRPVYVFAVLARMRNGFHANADHIFVQVVPRLAWVAMNLIVLLCKVHEQVAIRACPICDPLARASRVKRQLNMQSHVLSRQPVQL
eukprot:7286128-Pyramimonas_sp.AAC.1